MVDQRATLDISIARSEVAALSAIWPTAITCQPPIVIAAANDRSHLFAALVQSSLSRSYEEPTESNVVVPPALVNMTWQRLRQRSQQSTEIDLSAHTSRLSTVRILSSVANAGTVIVANNLKGEMGPRPTIAVGVWTRYTDVRDRLGYRLSASDKGAAAEVALAIRPTLIVALDRWQNAFIAFATSDPIVADLAGLALKQIKEGEVAEPVGPWEDPLVQRATELELGVRLPTQIAIRGHVGQGDTGMSHANVSLIVDAIALKLGVTETSVH